MTRVQVIHPSELGPAEIAAWHRMQRATPTMADPFLAPEYAMTVGRFRPQTRVGVLSEGPSVIGFFPFEARRLGTGVPVSGWLSPYQGVIHRPGARWSMSELLAGCGLAAWRFDNLIAQQAMRGTFQAAIATSPVIDLKGGFDTYYAQVRKRAHRFCREIERKGRKLGREVGTLRLEHDSRDPDLLSTLIDWKSDQYRRTSAVDRFDHPWIPRLLHALLATRGDYLSGLLSVLYAGEHPVSMQFGLRAGDIVVGWFTGYDYSFGKYSPGLLQIPMMAEALSALGVHTMYMGNGAKHSAQIFRNHDILVAEGMATSRSPLGTAHRVLNGVNRQALRTMREHPALHDVADRLLRITGASSRLYGKVLGGASRGAGSRPGKNRVDHVTGDAAGEGILLARVEAAEDEQTTFFFPGSHYDLGAVTERRAWPRCRIARLSEHRPERLPGKPAEADDHPHGGRD
jgi:CelD/BcsL family acetyltransferase involved in cellulose biosynthesis